jgi:tRNA (cytosine38-C5)-methyltransferase
MAWRKALRSRNYSVAHFHLNPTQCGIPNDRPRHYALAVLLESSPSNSASDVEGKSRNDDKNILNWFEEIKDTNSDKLEDSPPINTSMKALGVNEPGNLNILSPISDYLDPNDDNELDVPNKILNSNSSWCFDILTPSDRRSACFTSSYGKFVRGTGSVLYQTDGKNNESDQALDVFRLVKPEGREFDKNWKEGLDLSGNLRYFSSTEIARLFGFPVAPSTANEQSWMFRFPADCTMKQKWRLLGNSINVKVASQICEAGLRLVNQFS